MENDDIYFFSDSDLEYIVSPYSFYLLGKCPEFRIGFNNRYHLFGVWHGSTILTYCSSSSLDDTIKTLLD